MTIQPWYVYVAIAVLGLYGVLEPRFAVTRKVCEIPPSEGLVSDFIRRL